MCGMKFYRFSLFVMAVLAAGVSVAQSAGVGPGYNGARYATDAYPGFEDNDANVKPERKEPRWFSWFTGPNRSTAAEQFAYCQELLKGEDWSKAARQLDALVRNWPTAPEAWQAQEQLAAVQYEKLGDTEEAFKSYRYLLDFYSFQCDYAATADKLYKLAGVLKLEGKEVMFVRFANTVDVRRYYEMCVLRAPGAKWVPDAMLTIASLRVDEGRPEEAVKVYENIRNLYPSSPEAQKAYLLEASARMDILHECSYNRERCQDTSNFMKMALRRCRPEDAADIRAYLNETESHLADEAYRAAKFYDSRMRTRESAIAAYERFLENYPNCAQADEVRARLAELKGVEQK